MEAKKIRSSSGNRHPNGPPVRVAARGLTRRYGEGDSAVDALRALAVEEGQLTAVMGPSGSGKSTLLEGRR